MGFSLMLGGLGVYSAAMLHLVAHSFYKAHAFLSSGSTIDVIRASRIKSIEKLKKPIGAMLGFVLALIIFFSCSMFFKADLQEELSLAVVGAIIVLGLTRILAPVFDSKANAFVYARLVFLATAVTISFFSLEALVRRVIASQVPLLSMPTPEKIILATAMLLVFGMVVMLQALSPFIGERRLFVALGIHFRNGLYANALFDKVIGSLRIHQRGGRAIEVEQKGISRHELVIHRQSA
jgi:NAD(P)H-quinone oxidoreductase subunit 5